MSFTEGNCNSVGADAGTIELGNDSLNKSF